MIDRIKFQNLADTIHRETGELLWIGQPWEDAVGCLQRGVDVLIEQRNKVLAPRLADFFNHIKHGDEAHVEWLRSEFEKYWGVKV